MQNKKAVYFGILFLFILTLILGGIIRYQKNKQGMEIIFLNVGQGDAILIKQGSNQMLIDGGRSGKLLMEKLGKHIPFWDRQIEVVLATHPDQDHIGGLVDALKSYKVSEIIKTQAESESQTYKALAEEIKNENATVVEAKAGLKIKFPNGADMEVVYPFESVNPENKKDSNAGSVVAKLNFGENKFLFTGDLPSEQEVELTSNNINIEANVLKVSHHGSKYSTSEEFLRAVNAKEAIISAGRNNTYGHPAPEVLERLWEDKIKIFRTDEIGDIAYECADRHARCAIVAN